MALNREDYNDIKSAHGKALAKKISKTTRDYRSGGLSAGQRIERSLRDEREGKVVRLRSYTRSDEGRGIGHNVTKMKPRYKESDVYKQVGHTEHAKEAKEYEDRASRRYIGYNPNQIDPESKNAILRKYKS